MRALLLVAVLAAASSGHAEEFRHKRSALIAKVGTPHHSVVDSIVSPGRGVTVEGKFAYGDTSKDLEDERVLLELDKWKRTTLTNDDGRARVRIPGAVLSRPGHYKLHFSVPGDGSKAEGGVWVVAAKAKVVLFDVDGTITTSDKELAKFIVADRPIDVRHSAASLAKHYADKGILPIYLTGRPYLYNLATRQWLKKHGFPEGPLITSDYVGQSLPGSSRVGSFKTRWLSSTLRSLDLNVVAAYGNAKTDVCAFAKSGIAPGRTYIVGKYGGTACPGYDKTTALPGFRAHLRALR